MVPHFNTRRPQSGDVYDTILLPTDGSDGADRAADWAYALARTTGATVHVLSVVDTRSYSAGLAEVDPQASGQQRRLEERARGIAEATVDEHAGAGVESVTAVEYGIPDATVTDYAADQGADLIVMGTHGWTGLNRLLIGSTTERVVRSAEAPVLTVKSRDIPFDDDVERILLPMDRERGAEPAIAHALDLAAAYDATVHVLSVVEAGALVSGATGGGPLHDVLDAVEGNAQSVVDDVVRRATTAGVDTETTVTAGEPKGVIHDYVDEHGIDLVVMGTHGRTGLSRYLLGSVAERTVRTAEVPVLTVRSFEHDREGAGPIDEPTDSADPADLTDSTNT